MDSCLSQMAAMKLNPSINYKPSSFFAEQLTAFEMWLDYGHKEKKHPPQQLPIVLQVLLSQTQRLKALHLLGRFLNLGSWTVNMVILLQPLMIKYLYSPSY